MLRKCSLVCGLLAVVALALPAAASVITVNFVPQNSTIPGPGGTVNVDIVADIPQDTAVVGWGLDLLIVDPLIAVYLNDAVIAPPWTPAFTPDGDGLAGLSPPPPPGVGIFGPAVLLATLTFHGLSPGMTPIALSHDPLDPLEGFAIDPLLGGGFAPVNYVGGTVTVLPEPAALSLLAVALLALRRR